MLPAIGSYTVTANLSTDGTTDRSTAVGMTPTATQAQQNDPVLDVASAATRFTRPATGRLSEHPDLADLPEDEDAPIPAPTDTETATTLISGTASLPAMTPAELAEAEVALRDGQAQMSRARIQWSKVAVTQAERELRKAEAELKQIETTSIPSDELKAAEVDLQAAEANLQRSEDLGVPSEEVAAAETELHNAEAELQAVRDSATTADDVASGEQALRDAQAHLQSLGAGLDPALVSAAQDRLAVAQQNFETVAATASTNKTGAEAAMLQAADTVRLLQQAYSQSYWQNQQAQSGIDPQTNKTFDEEGLDAQTQQQHYADALAAVEQQLNGAQANLEATQSAFEQAKAQEIQNVAAARAQVDQAQAALQALTQGTAPADIDHARTQVDQAQTALAQLQQDFATSNAAITAAQARVDKAQHALTDLHAKLVDEARIRLTQLQEQKATADTATTEATKRVEQARAQLARVRQGRLDSTGWIWPTLGTLTSGFGTRELNGTNFHNGVDIANSADTPIGAARDGTVVEAGWCEGYGYCVKLTHDGGFSSEYGHLAGQPLVQVGQTVRAGTIIGIMGTTYDPEHGGYSTGVHLHFTLKHKGQAVDPLRYLP